MAITANALTANGGTFSGTSIATASISPTANRLVIALVGVGYNVAPGTLVLSLSGNGLTWVRISEQDNGRRLLGVFRAMGTPSAGAVTISSSSAAVEATATWAFVEFSGIDTSGTDGSGAVGTPAINLSTTGVTSLGVTITGTPATNDVTFAGFVMEDGSTSLVGDALWANLADSADIGDTRSIIDWDTGQDLTPTWTWTVSRSGTICGFIIKAAAGGATNWGRLLGGEVNRLVRPIT